MLQKGIGRMALLGAVQSVVGFAAIGLTAPRASAQSADTERGATVVVVGEATAISTDAPPGANDEQILRSLRERRAAEASGRTEQKVIVRVAEPGRAGDRVAVSSHAEKVTFLGVGASSAPAVLTHQLGLQSDVGLVVDQVEPDSPAAKAGLKQYDLIQKLDDQLLVDEHQLSVLVKGHKKGDSITLSLVRQGKPMTLTAKLGEHVAAEEGEGTINIAPGGLRFQIQGAPEGVLPLPPGASVRSEVRLQPGAVAKPEERGNPARGASSVRPEVRAWRLAPGSTPTTEGPDNPSVPAAPARPEARERRLSSPVAGARPEVRENPSAPDNAAKPNRENSSPAPAADDEAARTKELQQELLQLRQQAQELRQQVQQRQQQGEQPKPNTETEGESSK